MSPLLVPALVRLVEEPGGEVSKLLSYGIGALAFGILIFLLLALLGFGKGREHS